MTEPTVTQADRDLCISLNVPEYEALVIATHRHTSTAELRARVEVLEAENARFRQDLRAIAQPAFVAQPVGAPVTAWETLLNERMAIAKKALKKRRAKAALGGNDA